MDLPYASVRNIYLHAVCSGFEVDIDGAVVGKLARIPNKITHNLVISVLRRRSILSTFGYPRPLFRRGECTDLSMSTQTTASSHL